MESFDKSGINLKKSATRRKFLGLIAGETLALYFGVGTLNQKPPEVPETQEYPITTSSSEERVKAQFNQIIENPVPETGIVDYKKRYGITVPINSDGLPVNFSLDTGEKQSFNLESVLSARERAITNQEPELISIVELLPESNNDNIKTYKELLEQHDKKHSWLFELPPDVVSEEELKKAGITIIQGNKDKLNIRRRALTDGLLKTFNNTREKLTIVLVNGSILDQDFMQEARYDKYRGFLKPTSKEEIDKAKASEIKRWEENLKVIKEQTKKSKQSGSPGELEQVYHNLAQNKALLQGYRTFMPDSHILTAYNNNREFVSADARGLYIHHGLGSYHSATLVSIGSAMLDTDVAAFYFLPDGTFAFSRINGHSRVQKQLGINGLTYGINPYQSHPDPAQFSFNEKASHSDPHSYPYAGQTPGFTLRHELAHGLFITGDPQIPNYNEYDTDMEAMKGTRDAWNIWKNSNYTDNSLYDYALQTPFGVGLY